MHTNVKVMCIHCNRPIGNMHKSLIEGTSMVVPIYGATVVKVTVVPTRIFATTSYDNSYTQIILKTRIKCGKCSKHTTTELDVTKEYL